MNLVKLCKALHGCGWKESANRNYESKHLPRQKRYMLYYVPSPGLKDCAVLLTSSVCLTQARILIVTFIYFSVSLRSFFKTTKWTTPFGLSYFSYPSYSKAGLNGLRIFLSHTVPASRVYAVCFFTALGGSVHYFPQTVTSSLLEGLCLFTPIVSSLVSQLALASDIWAQVTRLLPLRSCETQHARDGTSIHLHVAHTLPSSSCLSSFPLLQDHPQISTS